MRYKPIGALRRAVLVITYGVRSARASNWPPPVSITPVVGFVIVADGFPTDNEDVVTFPVGEVGVTEGTVVVLATPFLSPGWKCRYLRLRMALGKRR